jgi:uncharacterized protein
MGAIAMRGFFGDVINADPQSQNVIYSFLRWVGLNGAKVLAFVPWALIKASSGVRFSAFGSPKSGAPDLSGVDDGRYDYGLSRPVYDVKFESKVMIPMRDGTRLVGDVFRPASAGRFPVIMAESPYVRYMNVNPGVDDRGGAGARYHQFEQTNPEYWVPRGYVYICFDARGFQGSEGKASVWDLQEAEDFYDAIEWAAAQPWSTGDIGLFGISYYAFSQYWVASLQPPHLKAIVPWEGLAEPYRDIAYRGGIPCFFALQFAVMMQFEANDLLSNQNYLKEGVIHQLFDNHWAKYTNPAPEDVEVPMLSVGGLNDPDLHLRGNVNSFIAARSPQKKLLLYCGTHWGSSFQPWANRTVLRFFDHWLKGMDTGIESEPAIDVQLRTGADTFTHVYGNSWPLEQTEWVKYYLDAHNKALNEEDAPEESSATAQLQSEESGKSEQVTFLTAPLEADVAIAGPLTAHIWVSSSRRDVDLTLELRDFDEDGRETMFAYVFAGERDEVVTHGWLRASHRALDPERSSPHQPYHPHTHNDWLTPGVPVALDVEIWPTGMLFKAGHRIGLTVHCGSYRRKGEVMGVWKFPLLSKIKVPMYRTFSPSTGTNKIHTGGDHSSWLEIPLIPADPAPSHEITIDDEKFSPATVTGQSGDRFAWSNAGDDYHSVIEQSGLRLWDSQLVRGIRSHYPETWWTKVPWAGTFDYRDEVSGFSGSIAIPVRVPGSAGAKNGIDIELGVEPAPDGIGFDVQLKTGDGEWENIKEGVRDPKIRTAKLSRGSYAVRSRLRSLEGDGAAASGWSPATSFVVE